MHAAAIRLRGATQKDSSNDVLASLRFHHVARLLLSCGDRISAPSREGARERRWGEGKTAPTITGQSISMTELSFFIHESDSFGVAK